MSKTTRRAAQAIRGTGRARASKPAVNAAIVLAAGEGSRIWPYNEVRNKCAVPVANKAAVRHTVEALIAVGVKQIIAVVGERKESIHHALGDLAEVRFVDQGGGKGTANATLAGLQKVEGEGAVLVVYGDVLCVEENFRALLGEYAAKQPIAACLTADLEGEDGQDWICVSVHQGKVAGVVGHARSGRGLRMAGVYVLSPQAIPYVRRNPGIVTSVPVGGMPPYEAELAQSIQMMVSEGREVLAVEATHVCVDLDKPWHITRANHEMVPYLFERLVASGKTMGKGAQIDESAEIRGQVVLAEGAVIGKRVVVDGHLYVGRNSRVVNGAMVRSAWVGEGSRVMDYCQLGGVVGDGCMVGHATELGGVIFDGVCIYHYGELSGVYGSKVDIGAATVCGTLRFDDGSSVIEVKGRKEVPRRGANCCFMGDYSRTGVNAILMPGVRVGCYSCVGPGVLVYKDVPSRTLVLAQQELVTKPWGPEQYGW